MAMARPHRVPHKGAVGGLPTTHSRRHLPPPGYPPDSRISWQGPPPPPPKGGHPGLLTQAKRRPISRHQVPPAAAPHGSSSSAHSNHAKIQKRGRARGAGSLRNQPSTTSIRSTYPRANPLRVTGWPKWVRKSVWHARSSSLPARAVDSLNAWAGQPWPRRKFTQGLA